MGGGEDKGDISCLVDIDVGDMLVVGGIGPRGSNRPPMGHLGGRGDSGHCSHPAITQTSAEDLASHDGDGGVGYNAPTNISHMERSTQVMSD